MADNKKPRENNRKALEILNTPLVMIKESPLVNNDSMTRLTKYYEFRGEKFQITFENSSGLPLGFNYKMCLSQYSKLHGKWHNLDDISAIHISEPPYFSDVEENLRYVKEYFKKMEDHLITVYNG